MADKLNKTIVITGGFGNLGLSVAKQAIARGAKVVLIDQAAMPDKAVFTGFNSGDYHALEKVNLTDEQQAVSALARAKDQFGRIDALLNIAGGFRWELFEESPVETWDFLYNINLKTAVVTTKAALPHIIEASGAIVCMSAGAALKADIGVAAYAASKAGVSRFVEALSQEVKDKNVRVNAVLPSIIDTPINRQQMPGEDFSRWVSPKDLANVLLFLVSDEAKAITGAQIPVSNKL